MDSSAVGRYYVAYAGLNLLQAVAGEGGNRGHGTEEGLLWMFLSSLGEQAWLMAE